MERLAHAIEARSVEGLTALLAEDVWGVVDEQLLRRALATLVLIAAGVPFPAVGIAAAIFFAWATFNHANLRLPLGRLECVLMTPRLHRVHHVSATTERNLGTVLTCWDRLRGSFLRADPPPDATFGLPRERRTYPQDWARQFVAPWNALHRDGGAMTAPSGVSAVDRP